MSNNGFPTNSTYVAPFTIVDREGDPLDLTDPDIQYQISKNQGGPSLVSLDETANTVTVEPDGKKGVVEVLVPANDVAFTGLVWEELRIRRTNANVAVSQRTVKFFDVATQA